MLRFCISLTLSEGQVPRAFESGDHQVKFPRRKVSEMQNLSMVFKSNFNYNHRVEHKKLL